MSKDLHLSTAYNTKILEMSSSVTIGEWLNYETVNPLNEIVCSYLKKKNQHQI